MDSSASSVTRLFGASGSRLWFDQKMVSSLLFWFHCRVQAVQKNSRLSFQAWSALSLLIVLFNGFRAKSSSYFKDQKLALAILRRNCTDFKQTQKRGKLPPNHFIAIPITNEKIRSSLEEAQKKLLEKAPKLKSGLIQLPTLHITLFVMHLLPHEIPQAEEALKDVVYTVGEKALGSLELDIEKLGNFRQGVVFAEIKKNREYEKLRMIADVVRQSFQEAQIPSSDERGFQPHLTIAKLSKMKWKEQKKIKKIKPEFYADFASVSFGKEAVKSIQICSMTAKKQKNGYYQTPVELPLFKEESDCQKIQEQVRRST